MRSSAIDTSVPAGSLAWYVSHGNRDDLALKELYLPRVANACAFRSDRTLGAVRVDGQSPVRCISDQSYLCARSTHMVSLMTASRYGSFSTS